MELAELRETIKIKAATLENKIVTGYYFKGLSKDYVLTDDGIERINPYDICRNTGIKDSDGKCVYEYDLIEYSNMDEIEYGYAEWSDDDQRYIIKNQIHFGGGNAYFDDHRFKSIGNIILYDEYYQKILSKEQK